MEWRVGSGGVGGLDWGMGAGVGSGSAAERGGEAGGGVVWGENKRRKRLIIEYIYVPGTDMYYSINRYVQVSIPGTSYRTRSLASSYVLI